MNSVLTNGHEPSPIDETYDFLRSKGWQVSRLGTEASINGLIVHGEKPVAKIVNGEVFSTGTGEKVGFMRDGYLCSLEGERLASFDALSSEGEALSERVQQLLKLNAADPRS